MLTGKSVAEALKVHPPHAAATLSGQPVSSTGTIRIGPAQASASFASKALPETLKFPPARALRCHSRGNPRGWKIGSARAAVSLTFVGAAVPQKIVHTPGPRDDCHYRERGYDTAARSPECRSWVQRHQSRSTKPPRILKERTVPISIQAVHNNRAGRAAADAPNGRRGGCPACSICVDGAIRAGREEEWGDTERAAGIRSNRRNQSCHASTRRTA